MRCRGERVNDSDSTPCEPLLRSSERSRRHSASADAASTTESQITLGIGQNVRIEGDSHLWSSYNSSRVQRPASTTRPCEGGAKGRTALCPQFVRPQPAA